MALVVASNMAALNTYNTLKKNDKKMANNLEKVSSGMKINSAKDDASGYAIAKKMSVMERSLQQDIRNVQTGNNLAAIAGGAVDDIVQNLRYLKEKAIDAANDTNTDTDREIIQKEVNQRLQHITDVSATTNYNGKVLLNGDYREIISLNQGNEGGTSTTSTDNWEVVNGLVVSKQNKVLSVGAFERLDGGSGNTQPGRTSVSVYGFGSTYEGATFSGRVLYSHSIGIKLDFYDRKYNENTGDFEPATVSDYHGEAFSLQFISEDENSEANWNLTNFVFDATINNSESKLVYSEVESDDPVISAHNKYTYYIGIKDVESIDVLPDSIFWGVRTANKNANVSARFDSNTEGIHGFVNEYSGSEATITWYQEGVVRIWFGDDPLLGHNVVGDRAVGEKITLGSGTYATDGTSINTLSNNGKPLIIHDGPKASQELHMFFNGMSPKDMGIDGLKVVPREAAEQAIEKIDNAITYSLNEATRIGAYQQRLEVDAANLVVAEENTTNAKSVIMDADMAKEMTDYSKHNVLLQAAQSMLAQSNQNSSMVLSLLQ
ncbi:MAG: flagellin [Anaerovibrio sp.]|uniref:flagellin n=1 Tax=Anaerovibrio sp. TaxID=1872532 RepID=UPI001B159EAA|nr:flagellin [Anaerovibrio sp.]MBO6246276.1 flagellin [Anaerovibrio sp.]